MIPQITNEERAFAEQHKADLQAWIDKKTDKGFRSQAESNPALIDELLEQWEKGEAFYISTVVVAPYNGCFHEPNIFLCTPPECDLYNEMNRHDVNGDRLVWQLYASGQGMCVDCLVSLSDIITWLANQSLSELATREEGRVSEHRRHHYGSFDSFELHDFGPIDQLPTSETYWAHAVRAAEEVYDVALPWTCVQCEKVHEGTGESCIEPIHTGYRGNGGVGAFMEGALCYECYELGVCEICRDNGGAPHELYDDEVVEYELDICSTCLDYLLHDAVTYDEEWDTALDAETVVCIKGEKGKLIVCYSEDAKDDCEKVADEDLLSTGIHIDTARVIDNMKHSYSNARELLDGQYRVLASALSRIAQPTEEN